MEKIRVIIAEKTAESDKLIDYYGSMLRDNRIKLEKFESDLQELETCDISIPEKSSIRAQVMIPKQKA